METNHINNRGKMLLKSNHLTDCSFYFPESKVQLKSNKTLLAFASPIMDAMFFGNSAFVEAETAIVEIHDIDVNVFEKFLLWIYAKELDLVDTDEAIAVYQAANKYEVIDLELICEQYIVANVTVESLGSSWKFAQLYNKTDLKEKVMKFIRRYTTQFIDSPQFLTSDATMLQAILEQDELWIANEMTLIKALERFAETNSVERKDLDAAVKCIRFKTIDKEKIIKFKSVLLSDEEKMAIAANIESDNASIGYPDGFSKSTIPRCMDYVRLSECEERLLKSVKELHYSGEEIDNYINYDERISEGTIGQLVFTDLEWYTHLKINSVLRDHLPRQMGEDNDSYLTRIFEDDNPRIIVALISCLKSFCFPDFLEIENFVY
ncbi:kelch-like protein 41b [Bradysia coprophila]|uniref:kelch-like protein 41b n=1 Tax=Bradysia coprophila TaxID=38358 RepID=UPI00187DD217|nr:kelch-like protein 41b [Bradysia coprophila]